MTSVGDLCDQGRCAQILRTIAEQKVVERVVDRNAAVMVRILTGTLADLNVDASDADVRAAMWANIRRVIEETPA